MTNDERGWCICQLVPGALYSGSWIDGSVVWLDGRPIPTDEEIEAEYERWQAEIAREECIAEAEATFNATIEAGYEHTDGHTYYCTRDGVMDLCMAVMLNDSAPEEPAYMLDIEGNIVEKTVAEFKALAMLIGRYHYNVRQTYWAALAACEV